MDYAFDCLKGYNVLLPKNNKALAGRAYVITYDENGSATISEESTSIIKELIVTKKYFEKYWKKFNQDVKETASPDTHKMPDLPDTHKPATEFIDIKKHIGKLQKEYNHYIKEPVSPDTHRMPDLPDTHPKPGTLFDEHKQEEVFPIRPIEGGEWAIPDEPKKDSSDDLDNFSQISSLVEKELEELDEVIRELQEAFTVVLLPLSPAPPNNAAGGEHVQKINKSKLERYFESVQWRLVESIKQIKNILSRNTLL